MTVKEAILKSLDDLKQVSSHLDIYKNIKKKHYYDFKMQRHQNQQYQLRLVIL